MELKMLHLANPPPPLLLGVKVRIWTTSPAPSGKASFAAAAADMACAGYNCCTSEAADAYMAIAKMLAESSKEAKRPILFNFTCMEMTNDSNGGVPKALSAPEDLIAQVRKACIFHQVPLAGENALEFDIATGDWAFKQMEKQIRSFSPGVDAMHGLTLLRLSDNFVRLGTALPNELEDPGGLRSVFRLVLEGPEREFGDPGLQNSLFAFTQFGAKGKAEVRLCAARDNLLHRDLGVRAMRARDSQAASSVTTATTHLDTPQQLVCLALQAGRKEAEALLISILSPASASENQAHRRITATAHNLRNYSDMMSSPFCKTCEPGTYSDLQGSWYCEECAIGHWTNTSGSTKCSRCKPGRYAGERGYPTCDRCDPGTYSNWAHEAGWVSKAMAQDAAAAAAALAGIARHVAVAALEEEDDLRQQSQALADRLRALAPSRRKIIAVGQALPPELRGLLLAVLRLAPSLAAEPGQCLAPDPLAAAVLRKEKPATRLGTGTRAAGTLAAAVAALTMQGSPGRSPSTPSGIRSLSQRLFAAAMAEAEDAAGDSRFRVSDKELRSLAALWARGEGLELRVHLLLLHDERWEACQEQVYFEVHEATLLRPRPAALAGVCLRHLRELLELKRSWLETPAYQPALKCCVRPCSGRFRQEVLEPLCPERRVFAELLPPSPPEAFVSHCWSESFEDCILALQRYAVELRGWRSWCDCSFWLGLLSQPCALAEDFDADLRNLNFGMTASGLVVVVLGEAASWPTRLWCLYELLQARDASLPVEICSARGVLGRRPTAKESRGFARRLLASLPDDARCGSEEDGKQLLAHLSPRGGLEALRRPLVALAGQLLCLGDTTPIVPELFGELPLRLKGGLHRGTWAEAMSRMTSRSCAVDSGAVKIDEMVSFLRTPGQCLLLEGRPTTGRALLARHVLARLAEGGGTTDGRPWLPVQANCAVLGSMIRAGDDSSDLDLLGQWLTEEHGKSIVEELGQHFAGVALLLEGLERAGHSAAALARWATCWLSKPGMAKSVLLTSRPSLHEEVIGQSAAAEESGCDLWGLADATTAEREWARAAAANLPDGGRLLQVQMQRVADMPCFLPLARLPSSLAGVGLRGVDQQRMLEQPFSASILLHILDRGDSSCDLFKLNCLEIYGCLTDAMWQNSGWKSDSADSEGPAKSVCENALQQLALDMCSHNAHIVPVSNINDLLATPFLCRVGGRHARFAHVTLQSYFAALEILRRMDVAPQVLGQSQWPQVKLFLKRGLEAAIAAACRCMLRPRTLLFVAVRTPCCFRPAGEGVGRRRGGKVVLEDLAADELGGLLGSTLGLVGRVLRVGGGNVGLSARLPQPDTDKITCGPARTHKPSEGLQLSEQLLVAAQSSVGLEHKKRLLRSFFRQKWSSANMHENGDDAGKTSFHGNFLAMSLWSRPLRWQLALLLLAARPPGEPVEDLRVALQVAKAAALPTKLLEDHIWEVYIRAAGGWPPNTAKVEAAGQLLQEYLAGFPSDWEQGALKALAARVSAFARLASSFQSGSLEGWHPSAELAAASGLPQVLVEASEAAFFARRVAAGRYHSVLLRRSGGAVAFGLNAAGESLLPRLPAGVRYIAVAAGTQHTLLLRSDGRVGSCGLNLDGQRSLIGLEGRVLISVAAGGFHSVLLDSDGSCEAVGCNDHGQCQVSSRLSGRRCISIAAGAQHTICILEDGNAIAVGLDDNGQCSIPAISQVPVPQKRVSWLRYTSAAGGSKHTVLLRNDGEAAALGWNAHGQCSVPPLLLG
ncbi:RCC1 [Symbiodinium sp. CCMP2456]|nr:RCC1 [Symbiodinium sp. CCMP2456]